MRPPSGPIDVTVPSGSGRRKRAGIRIHRSQRLNNADVTIHEGIPVTTPARTLADLRGSVPPSVHRAIRRQAEIRRYDLGPDAGPPAPPWTEIEHRLLALCRRHGVPAPRTQVVVGAYTVDFLWEHVRLVVEVDGYATHGTRSAFEDDRARDADLAVLGYQVVRFTWRHLVEEPRRVVETLRALLQPGRASP